MKFLSSITVRVVHKDLRWQAINQWADVENPVSCGWSIDRQYTLFGTPYFPELVNSVEYSSMCRELARSPLTAEMNVTAEFLFAYLAVFLPEKPQDFHYSIMAENLALLAADYERSEGRPLLSLQDHVIYGNFFYPFFKYNFMGVLMPEPKSLEQAYEQRYMALPADPATRLACIQKEVAEIRAATTPPFPTEAQN